LQARNIKTHFQKEREILQKLSIWKHPYIMDFIGSFEVQLELEFGHFDLILPYAEGGNLYDFLRLSVPPPWLYMGTGCEPFYLALFIQTRGIVDALAFLHEKQSHVGFVIHRDIKPAIFSSITASLS
jgi:serine/threonine protein kinase